MQTPSSCFSLATGNLVHLVTFDVSHNHLEHLPQGSYFNSHVKEFFDVPVWSKFFDVGRHFRSLDQRFGMS